MSFFLYMNISSVVEAVLKKHTKKHAPRVKDNISSNLEFRLLFTVDLSKPFKQAKKDFLKNYLNDILTLSLGNISLAAKRAQLHRRHLHRIINDLEINPNLHKKELLKPQEYLRENVHNIIEDTLSHFEEDDRIRQIYSNLDDISVIISKNMGPVSYDEALELFEKEYIEKALKENNYNISETADAIDMGERTLYRKISRLNIAVV